MVSRYFVMTAGAIVDAMEYAPGESPHTIFAYTVSPAPDGEFLRKPAAKYQSRLEYAEREVADGYWREVEYRELLTLLRKDMPAGLEDAW